MKRQVMGFAFALTLCLFVSYSLVGSPLLRSHTGPRQDRSEMLETLLRGNNPAAQIQAAKRLIPYISEPEVKSAFTQSARKGKNQALRAIAAKALGANFFAENEIQELLIGLLKDSEPGVRLAAAQSFGEHLDDPNIFGIWTSVVKNDKELDVRVQLIKDLGPKIDKREAYDLMLDITRTDPDVIGRASALDALALKIKERPELRELFLAGLDDNAYFYQLHALKGLVELQDPDLKPRLVSKAASLVVRGVNEKWFNELIDDAVSQLKKLDPREAENVINNLKTTDK